jgi:YHS domain-containing protein
MNIRNRKFLLLAFVVCVAAVVGACSRTAPTAALGFNTNADGLALRGFDAVAYFAVDSAVKGDPKFEYAWNGAKWLFSSEENMKKFQENPEAYAPQFGGYCSFAVSEGYTADGDPEAWKIADGKLFLNYNKQVKEKWEQNQAERIEKGKSNWEQFKKKKPEHKG